MRVLIIGGTAFVGRHITQAALAAEHEVTLFNRGRTGANLFPEATNLVGDRNSDLSALADGEWDATIDVCAYFPRQVRELAIALGGRGGRGGHHGFISSTSAYRTDATTIVRPTYVIGPYDRSYRFTWWVERIAAGGAVLAPGDRADPIQVIDARDMATWIVALAARSVTGIFHAVSPEPPFGFGELLTEISAAVAPPGTELIWASTDFLLAEGETGVSLPLWPGDDSESDINAADPGAATAAGLRPRPIRQSAADVHAAELAAPTPIRPGTGISRERESELLARWRARQES